MLVASTAIHAQTQKTTISLGGASAKLGDKTVLLPAPDGYEEVSQQWESLKTAFVAMVPREGDLLAAYLPVSDCELLRKGQPPLMPSWAMINIYREARTHVSSNEEFAGIVAYARQNTESLIDPQNTNIQEHFAHIEEFLSNAISKDMKLDLSKPKVLGQFDIRPNVYSNLLLLKLTLKADGNAVEQPPLLATMSLVLVKERVITILTYKKLESKADAEMLRQLTTKWINGILAAN